MSTSTTSKSTLMTQKTFISNMNIPWISSTHSCNSKRRNYNLHPHQQLVSVDLHQLKRLFRKFFENHHHIEIGDEPAAVIGHQVVIVIGQVVAIWIGQAAVTDLAKAVGIETAVLVWIETVLVVAVVTGIDIAVWKEIGTDRVWIENAKVVVKGTLLIEIESGKAVESH